MLLLLDLNAKTVANIPFKFIKKIASGAFHQIIIADKVYSLGSNYYGQAGYLNDEEVDFPTEIPVNVLDVCCGDFHNIGINDKVYTWGAGILGRGNELYDSIAYPLDLPANVKIGARNNTSWALVENKIFGWGYLNSSKQLVPTELKSLDWDSITSVDFNQHQSLISGQINGEYVTALFGNQGPFQKYPYPLYENVPLLSNNKLVPVAIRKLGPVKSVFLLQQGFLIWTENGLFYDDLKTTKFITRAEKVAINNHSLVVWDGSLLKCWRSVPELVSNNTSIWPWKAIETKVLENGIQLHDKLRHEGEVLGNYDKIDHLAVSHDKCIMAINE